MNHYEAFFVKISELFKNNFVILCKKYDTGTNVFSIRSKTSKISKKRGRVSWSVTNCTEKLQTLPFPFNTFVFLSCKRVFPAASSCDKCKSHKTFWHFGNLLISIPRTRKTLKQLTCTKWAKQSAFYTLLLFY